MSILFDTTEVIILNANIIALSNQKGGTGKTTTCANLGIGLAQEGKRVLVVDNDPQASLTISLGWTQPDKLPVTLSTLMGRAIMDEPIRAEEAILHHSEGVDVLPASIELSGMEVSLVNAISRESVLRQVLEELSSRYDHMLIDCMPSLGMLTINALAAANSVIIPVQAQYLPAKGLEQLLQTVAKVRRQLNPRLKIDGIAFFELAFEHFRVLAPDVVIFIALGRDRNAFGKILHVGPLVDKGELDADGGIKVIEKITVILKDLCLIIGLGKLVVNIKKLNGLGKELVIDAADPVLIDLPVGDRLLGGLRRVPLYPAEKAALARRLSMGHRLFTGLFDCGPVFSRLPDVCLQALFLCLLLFGFWQYLFPPSST